MKIAVGADHAGVELKRKVLDQLEKTGHSLLNLGTHDSAPVDYPDYTALVCEKVISGEAERGIVICGSGIGACIAANKFKGILAGLCHDLYSARQAVEHDNTNVLCLGARVLEEDLALKIVDAWVGARFSGEQRHQRRLKKIHDIENR